MRATRLSVCLPLILAACAAPEGDPFGDDDDAPLPPVETEVLIESEGLTLEGTLALPGGASADAPVPGVVLVHGSGPRDRDESVSLTLPQVGEWEVRAFADLSDALVQAGYAVLRYDKRTCGPFNGLCDNDYPLPEDVLVSDFLLDAEAALDFLGAREEVASDRLAIAGHSQGGTFVPMTLGTRDDLAAGIMLAGPYRPIDELLAWQIELNRGLYEEAGASEAQFLAAFGSIIELVEALAELRAGTYEGDMSESDQAFWLEWMRMTDDAPALLPGLDRPMLVISGDYDWNVPPEETEAWGADIEALPSHPGHRAVVLPCVAHSLSCIREEDWLRAERSDVDDFVSPALISELVAFLDAHAL